MEQLDKNAPVKRKCDITTCATFALGLICAGSFGALLWSSKGTDQLSLTHMRIWLHSNMTSGPEAAGDFTIGYLLEMYAATQVDFPLCA